MDNNPRPYEWVIMGSGLVMLVTSFFSWFSVEGNGETQSLSSAWGPDFLPLATIIPVLGLLLAVLVAVNRFTTVEIPDPVVGLPLSRLYLSVGALAVLTALGLLIMDKVPDSAISRSNAFADGNLTFSFSPSVGFWLNLLGAIGLVVGGVLAMQDEGSVGGGASGPAAPPQAF